MWRYSQRGRLSFHRGRIPKPSRFERIKNQIAEMRVPSRENFCLRGRSRFAEHCSNLRESCSHLKKFTSYLCVLALMVLKTLQEKLQKQGTPMSAQQVSRALEQALVMAIPSESTSDCRFINLDMQERFHAARTTGKGCYERDLNETVDHEAVWESFKAERISKAHDMDLILEAVGLKPFPLLMRAQ